MSEIDSGGITQSSQPNELAIKIDHVSKEYRLGAIGGGTLKGDLQSWWAKKSGKEDPNLKIGQEGHALNEKFLALDDVSFEVKKGERVGLIGHNGAGKSTLLKLLSRVTAPTMGTISYNGRIASMLEVGTGFHPELTGRENIYMNGAILGMNRAEVSSKIDDIIEFSECRQFIDTPVKRYSSGMYVKLAFSVASHLDSEIMIMDEVLAVGDMAFQKKCLEKMRDVSRAEGRTILYVSHNMNTIRQLCDRCIVLNHGKVIFNGDVESAIDEYLGCIPDSPKIIDLSERKRDLMTTKMATLTKIEILERSSWRIPVGEKLRFQIEVKADADLKDVGYRSRLTTSDGRSITVLLAPKLLNCQAGEKCIVPMEADISGLTPGRYCLTPVLYETDDYGTWVFHDHINSAVSFEIVNELGFNENMAWDSFYWGNVKFPDIVDLRGRCANQ